MLQHGRQYVADAVLVAEKCSHGHVAVGVVDVIPVLFDRAALSQPFQGGAFNQCDTVGPARRQVICSLVTGHKRGLLAFADHFSGIPRIGAGNVQACCEDQNTQTVHKLLKCYSPVMQAVQCPQTVGVGPHQPRDPFPHRISGQGAQFV